MSRKAMAVLLVLTLIVVLLVLPQMIAYADPTTCGLPGC